MRFQRDESPKANGARNTNLPDTQQPDQKTLRPPLVQKLRNEENVGNKGGLEHNRHVGGVEKLNGVRTLLTTVFVGLDGDLNTETLKVDHDSEDRDGGNQVGDVGKVVTVQGFLQCAELVVTGQKEVEECNDCSLELGAFDICVSMSQRNRTGY